MGKWLLSRISMRGALAALPLLAIGVLFAARLRPNDEIEMALLFEIQVVLLFPLVVGPARARPRHWFGHVARWSVLVGVLVLFLGKGAYDEGGLLGVATIVVLMLATYSGALFGPEPERRLGRLVARFVIGMTAVFGSCILSGILFGWPNSPVRDAWWGAICMFILAIGEFFLSAPAPETRNQIVARREEYAERLRAFADEA